MTDQIEGGLHEELAALPLKAEQGACLPWTRCGLCGRKPDCALLRGTLPRSLSGGDG